MINCCSHPRRATTINQRSRWDRDLDTQKCENGCELYISVEDYDDKKDNQTILDIVDGMHRSEGGVVATEKKLAEKGSYIKGGL